jgi:HlyD family secretion protein
MSATFIEYMKKRSTWVFVALVVVTVSVAAYYRANAGDDRPQYTTAVVTREDLVDTVEATGTLGAVTTVQVGSQVSGTISSLNADFNSEVKKGQVIARLDPSLMQAQVDQADATIVRLQADVDRAQAALEDAQQKLNRGRELLKQGLVPKADVDTAESTERQAEASLQSAKAQVTQARASLNQNRVNLNHTVITAPVDGIVISRNVDVGQTVAASMSAPTLFVIAKDLTHMQVEASVDEADIGRIRQGEAVTFRVDAYPREVFKGTVSQVRLQPVVVQNVVSYVTVIDVPNPEKKLKPGMTATVTIEIARADDVLTVPNSALRFRPPDSAHQSGTKTRPIATAGGARSGVEGGSFDRGRRVWTLSDGQLQPVRVETGISNGTATAVSGDELREGMTIVTGAVAADSAAPSAGTSPLIPQRRGGGNRQGGGGAGRGGRQ